MGLGARVRPARCRPPARTLGSAGAVSAALEDALSFLTGDQWNISFVPRLRDIDHAGQQSLGFDVRDRVIMPYSDGVDSRAVSALVDSCRGKADWSAYGSAPKARTCVPRIRAERRFMSVPYRVRLERWPAIESSARSRGFKFAVITGIAAALANVKRIVVTESGQGALGPILVTLGKPTRITACTPHLPAVVEALFEALIGPRRLTNYPQIWSTKGETVAAANRCRTPATWANTHSCWQSARQVSFRKQLRQCGICAACMLRRLSMHSAGVAEPASNYIWEDLSAPDIRSGAVAGFTLHDKSLEEHAIAGVLQSRSPSGAFGLRHAPARSRPRRARNRCARSA